MTGRPSPWRTRAPLTSIRVIDFGHHLAGPLAGMLLADQGAEVVKVERPGPAGPASAAGAVFNRGKRSVEFDLKNAAGLEEARALIAEADVVIENFRPGVMDRLGLGADEMTRLNPRLVYLALPGFASDDADSRALPAWEGVMSAACGVFSELNVLQGFLGLPPVYSALPLASVYGAVHGALAVTLALRARETSGRGDVVEVPLVSAGASAMGSQQLMSVPAQPPRYDLPPVPRPLARFVMPGVRALLSAMGTRAQRQAYRAARTIVPALLDSYPCADGRLLYIYALDHSRLGATLLAELGLLDALTSKGLVNEDPYKTTRPSRNLADSSVLSAGWQRRIRRHLAAKLREKPAQQWEEELNAAGVPCTVQRSTREWLAQPALREAGIVLESETEPFGPLRQPGPQAWIAAVPDRNAKPRVRPSESRSQTPAAGQDGPPSALQGAVVVDLSTMIAGPACARTLAEYGARVIKVENPRPRHGPRMTCWLGIDVDQGKESILLDIAEPRGRSLLWRLLERADVLVHNLSKDATARLDLDYEALARRFPDLVVCHTGAYDGPRPGPWAGRKGYDPVLQAATGIMLRYGDSRHPEHHGLTSCVDYLTAYSAAFAVALGLWRRARDPEGRGCLVATSLAQAAQLVQGPLAIDHAGRAWNEPCGQQALGERALHRLYRARDRWLFLAAAESKRDALPEIDQLGCTAAEATGPDGELARFLEGRLRERTAAVWRRAFGAHDIAVQPVERFEDIRERLLVPREGAEVLTGGASLQVVRQPHPAGGQVDTVAPAHARLRRSPLRFLAPAPKPGANTRALLAEIGLDASERDRLYAEGLAADQVSADYLPS